MAKIRVSDLAKKMGVPHQDLVFKLRSIGVRLEGEDDSIDTDIIQAILTGKKLAQPREVILRDEAAAATAPPTPARRPPSRRVPPNPLRGPRRRTMIQRVEPRIRTIPTREKPAAQPGTPEEPTPPATEVAPAAATAPAAEVPATPAAQPATPGETAAAAVVATEAPVETRRQRRKERQGGEEGAAPRDATVTISEGITVRELAEKLGLKAKDLIRQLIDRGVMASVNQVLDADTAERLAADLGFDTMQVTFEEEVQLQDEARQPEGEEHLEPRAPVITVMGHIDHGKTSLLDAIRKARVAASESGGITQHIGAYKVEVGGRGLVFLDTPGHEAFTKLRARGAQATDIVILMVAADDSVMPQTIEAIDHAKAAGVPMVVAINKIDKANANVDRVKKDLADHGVLVEEWGGDVVAVPMSAVKGEGIDEMIEILNLTADLLDLKADPHVAAQGVVLEARKDPGRGNLATVLVQRGTLHVGDTFVSGSTLGRVRSLQNDRGDTIKEAPPSTPAEVSGFTDLPNAGDMLQVVENEAKARSIAEYRQEEERQRELAPTHGSLSLDQLFDRIQSGDVAELPIILKADVQGSLEVLRDALAKLSTPKVKVKIIHGGVGAITTTNVTLAMASDAIIVGFNVRPEKSAAELASQEGVDIRTHTVIYELLDELKQAMTGLLKPTFREVDRGRAEVRDTFKIPRIGTIAGCHVIEGVIPRGAQARLLRDNVVVYEGRVASLRRFKDDAAEVRSGFDCGIGLERFQDIKPGDFIEVFEREEVAATL